MQRRIAQRTDAVDPSLYARLGLASNPFLATGPLVGAHVDQAADAVLARHLAAALDGRSAGPLAIVGPTGSGRSHRLAVVAERARQAGAVRALHAVGDGHADGLVSRLASAVLAGSRLGRLEHALAAPRWYRGLLSMTRRPRGVGDPAADGRALARALEANVPAVVLVDDLHRLPFSRAADRYMETLRVLADAAGPAVHLAWTCPSDRLASMLARFPSLDTDRWTVALQPFTDLEATRLVAGRLASVRVAAEPDALHPFRPETVAAMNGVAAGNPKRLVDMAALMLEQVARSGAAEAGPQMVVPLRPVPQSSSQPSRQPALRPVPQLLRQATRSPPQ